MYRIVTDPKPPQKDIQIVRAGIIAFNSSVLGEEDKDVYVFLKDEQDDVKGGVLGMMTPESMFVHILWIEEALRGQDYGTKLLRAAEMEAINNGCRYSVLDTFEFQAEGFYLKNGYKRMGEIKDYISGYSRIFLKKELR